MAFNSLNFFIFFAIVYLFYLLLRHKGQNRMLLVASYFFYGCWDWRFLSLLLISTITDYLCGIQIAKYEEKKKKRRFVALSLCINLGILGFFKYFNFFIDSLLALLSIFGIRPDIGTLSIILPVGISFYTFQTLSYTIDVYRKQVKPCRNFLDYALYVAFFPQLVAGPIERGKNLLPQVQTPRTVTHKGISEGFLLIYWGLFKKLFIADNLGIIVDDIFAGMGSESGGLVLLGMYAFSFQIYCDFSAYSDIARGVAELMGFEIMVNFDRPYFAGNIQEFWKRWHVSLTTWIRDYLYYPLALTRIRKRRINVKLLTFITFLIMGLWHGAAWNFVLWGGYHGALLVLYILWVSRIRARFGFERRFEGFLKIGGVIFTFHLCALGSLLFRSRSLSQVLHMVYALFANFEINDTFFSLFSKFLFLISPLMIVESIESKKRQDLNILFNYPKVIRYAFYSVIFYLMAAHSSETTSFIYFQF